MAYLPKKTKTITIVPHYPFTDNNPYGNALPAQAKFHESTAKYKLYAGGWGSGKTLCLCMEILHQLYKHPGNRGMLIRDKLVDLKMTTLKELLLLCPEGMIQKHDKQGRTIYFNTGRNKPMSELIYTGLDQGVERLRGHNLGFCAVDELSEMSEEMFLTIISRLRKENTDMSFISATNPNGRSWIWDYWINEENKNDAYYALHPEFKRGEFFYINSATTDNPYLPETYVKTLLQTYPEAWIRRYIFCSWDDFEGLCYSSYIPAKHSNYDIYTPLGVEEFYVVLDYGWTNPTAIIWACVDFDGNIRIYDEFYQTNSLVSDTAKVIKNHKYWENATLLIDPASAQKQRDGKSVLDEFADNGIYFIKANNEVLQGINRVNEFFKADCLFIGRNCRHAISEIGNYRWAAVSPGRDLNEPDRPVKNRDHLMDCIRYLVNHINTPTKDIKLLPDWYYESRERMKKRNKALQHNDKYSCLGV